VEGLSNENRKNPKFPRKPTERTSKSLDKMTDKDLKKLLKKIERKKASPGKGFIIMKIKQQLNRKEVK
tara:strand:+ start:388 stop:591 length:204 start_codon:yes stop_codon:yes gene_type:complete